MDHSNKKSLLPLEIFQEEVIVLYTGLQLFWSFKRTKKYQLFSYFPLTLVSSITSKTKFSIGEVDNKYLMKWGGEEERNN